MPHSTLLLQLAVILVAARACGLLLRHVGQPPVIGEMAAGLLLGPIVFGAWFPQAHAALFAVESLPGLASLSTLGLVLFMFIIGAELRAPNGLARQLRETGAIGLASVAVPIGTGLAIAPLLHPLAPAGVAFWPFALFVGVAMSITAFPVMARILKDRGMARSRIGRLAMGSAAVADVLAWILLALVVALVGTGSGYAGFLKTMLGAIAMCAFVFGVLRPVFAWLLARCSTHGPAGMMALTTMMACLFGCAAATRWLGLHEAFGAFLFGACLPRDDRLLGYLEKRIEPLSIAVLMPVFFTLAGLGTSPDAFSGASLGIMLLVVLAAVAGKVLGGAAGARIAGHPWRDSLAIGSLMNARGLMELVVMKIGLDAGVIGPALFTMLLVMALLTTLMASPLLSLFSRESTGVDASDP